MNQIHFCGGLPRCGSTVLMNILQQNPRIFTTASCALYEILKDKILIKGRFSETFQAMSTEQADRAMYGLIHGATKGWFEALTTKPIVISKRHGWSGLFHLYPDSKFICMVRDIRDIVESFEKINSNIQSLHSFGQSECLIPSMHMLEKYKYYFSESNSLSANLTYEIPRLMEVFKRNSRKVLFVRYEDFTKDPIYILNKIYSFIDEEYHQHDLTHIEQSELFEHDHAYFRERTEHLVAPKFKLYNDPIRNMPPEFHAMILKEFKWYYEAFYPLEIS